MLFATTIGADGAPTKEVLLDGRACDCCQTTAALTANGPIVAYRDRTATEIRDIYVTRRVGGTWTEPKAVYADNWEINACPVNGPYVDAAGQRVALAWYTGAKDVPRVRVAFSSDAGATFGAPITVDEGKPAGRVAAVLLKDGSALVSWIERTGGDTASVRVRRVTEKGAGPATTVAASSAARASGFPAWHAPATTSGLHGPCPVVRRRCAWQERALRTSGDAAAASRTNRAEVRHFTGRARGGAVHRGGARSLLHGYTRWCREGRRSGAGVRDACTQR